MTKLSCLISLLGQLKDLPRSGWLCKSVQNPESVADHSFGVALLTLLLAPEHLDRNKCLKLAIVHDLSEAIVGDYTPFDNISREEKSNLETKAQKKLVSELESAELAELFAEYEANQTPEAQFVHDIDRLEAVIQAKYYENNRPVSDLLSEFIEYASKHLNDEKGIAAMLIAELCPTEKVKL